MSSDAPPVRYVKLPIRISYNYVSYLPSKRKRKKENKGLDKNKNKIPNNNNTMRLSRKDIILPITYYISTSLGDLTLICCRDDRMEVLLCFCCALPR